MEIALLATLGRTNAENEDGGIKDSVLNAVFIKKISVFIDAGARGKLGFSKTHRG